MVNALPSDFVRAVHDEGMKIVGNVATDTETSGLFADAGARVSTASIGFVARPEDGWDEWANRWDNVTYGLEQIAPGYDEWLLSVAWPFDQGVTGKPEDTGQGMLWPEANNLPEEEWDALLSFLSNHDLDFHHAKFDLEKYRVGLRAGMGKGRELEFRAAWDSQNVNDLLWGWETTSLKPSVERLTGKPWADEAEAVMKYLTKAKLPAGRWDLIPWDILGPYADTDARITVLLELRQKWEIQQNKAASWLYERLTDKERDDRNNLGLGDDDIVFDMVNRRLATSRVLYHMERRGVPYDEVGSREAAIECRQRASKVGHKLPFHPNPNMAKKYFFGDGVTDKGEECLSLVPYSVTDKGTPQLTAEIVGRMVEDRVPFAAEWAEWSRVSNAASMWYEGYADAIGADGRLRCAFRQNGTRSTRFSVERLNLQAIPQDYRLSEYSVMDGILTPRQLIASGVPDGWRLYELDLEQAELRVGTMIAKCKLMEEMIREGVDLHTFTTKALFPDIDPDTTIFQNKWRQVGKRGNFSLQFGSGGSTFRKMVSKETGIILSDNEAERIVRDWNGLYPEFSRAIKKHQDVVARRQARYGKGWLSLYNGERRWFQPYEEAHKAFNQRVQGNLAQFGIDWMLRTDPFLINQKRLHKQAEADGVGEPGLVLTIHDSQVLLLPDDQYGRDLAAQCAEFGQITWGNTFTGIPGGVGYHAWDKVSA